MKHLRKLIQLIGLFVLCFSAQAQYVSDSRVTQSTSLQITNGSYITEAQVHAVCIPLAAGKVVSVTYQAEVTNPNVYNVGIGSVIRTWDYQVDTNGSQYVSQYNTIPPVMENVTKDTHHMVIRGALADTVSYPKGGNTRCYTLVLWAVADGGAGIIKVEQGYGFLQVLVH
ncbi:hypothetical protein P26218_24 [Rhodoferax phage P26218]|uniref:hypothetical protein n=1 Tax=Rhodoferax phage P26218 TaxID=1636270 RepID=UPI0005FEB676|nr:hypothetical protein AXJ08_gp24 [Rhodoferax phage P26218]AKA60327.1 hypothetical protein P26218_24 [Rhodoferax phage P26218]